MEQLCGTLLCLLHALITWRLTQCNFNFIIKNYCFVHLYSLSVEGTDDVSRHTFETNDLIFMYFHECKHDGIPMCA